MVCVCLSILHLKKKNVSSIFFLEFVGVAVKKRLRTTGLRIPLANLLGCSFLKTFLSLPLTFKKKKKILNFDFLNAIIMLKKATPFKDSNHFKNF